MAGDALTLSSGSQVERHLYPIILYIQFNAIKIILPNEIRVFRVTVPTNRDVVYHAVFRGRMSIRSAEVCATSFRYKGKYN